MVFCIICNKKIHYDTWGQHLTSSVQVQQTYGSKLDVFCLECYSCGVSINDIMKYHFKTRLPVIEPIQSDTYIDCYCCRQPIKLLRRSSHREWSHYYYPEVRATIIYNDIIYELSSERTSCHYTKGHIKTYLGLKHLRYRSILRRFIKRALAIARKNLTVQLFKEYHPKSIYLLEQVENWD